MAATGLQVAALRAFYVDSESPAVRLTITAPQLVVGTVVVAVLGAVTLIWLSGETSFTTTNKSAIERMLKGMSAKPSGPFDRDFAATMVAHHQGAIDMPIDLH